MFSGFSAPTRFLFFVLWHSGITGTGLENRFTHCGCRFSRPYRRMLRLRDDSLRLYLCATVNHLPTMPKPSRWLHQRQDYALVPSRHFSGSFTIFFG
ncbi:hypothetical protein KCP76_20235 [Salmonella enterica subsp. enterica serovar Weltevreden]|nr:hypothetical protein KCP76_20235 [Salmonella enterica subsp. enterica serovar Weltevreden]